MTGRESTPTRRAEGDPLPPGVLHAAAVVGICVGMFLLAALVGCASASPSGPVATSSAVWPLTAVHSVSPLPTPTALASPTASPEPDATAVSPIPVYTYRVVRTYPHDPGAYTQGLVLADGLLYEGTGLVGRSSLRRVDLETGQVLKSRALPEPYFGEGIAVFGDAIFQLTWKSGTGFVYDRETFDLERTFTYATQGWGLTTDGRRLIMSDGTSRLRFLDPETLQELSHVEVLDDQGPVIGLNELEHVEGEIWANVWQTDRIARIDPATGRVTGFVDLMGILDRSALASEADVLNGIAYDTEEGRLYVTGKLWPWLFEIEVVPSGVE